MSLRINTKDFSKKMFTFTVALMPFLVSIPLPIVSSLSFGDLVIVIFSTYLLLIKNRIEILNGRTINLLTLFASYVVLSFIFGKLTFNKNYIASSGWYGISIFILTFIICIPRGLECFDFFFARKIIQFIAVIATVLLILQYFSFYVLGRHLMLVPINIYTEQIKELYGEFARTGLKWGQFRPCAFFLEPAHFAQYCSLAIVLLLFSEQKKKVIYALFITLGVVLTTSGIGFTLSFVIWSIYVVFAEASPAIKTGRIILGIIFAITIFYFIRDKNFFLIFVNRVFSTQRETSALYARGSSYELWAMLNPLEKVFGVGYGFEPNIYMVAMAKYLYRVGIVGVIFLVLPVLATLRNLKLLGKVLVIVWFLIFITGDISGMYYFLMYWLLFLSSKVEEYGVNGKHEYEGCDH